ncbi:hypothetical protein TNCV_2339181 [Trichonephila clavipes]|nr:hypothetical protein TNCV_2339181 [Trichonephila clavipes]
MRNFVTTSNDFNLLTLRVYGGRPRLCPERDETLIADVALGQIGSRLKTSQENVPGGLMFYDEPLLC